MDFTIVTPSYNQARFLPATLDCVLAQRGDFTLDYIVMDGGSTDGSADILRQYAADLAAGKRRFACRGGQFRWFSERDRGQSHAVNKGFALAQGEILGWLNSDDLYDNDHVLARVQGRFAAQPTAEFVYGRGYRVDEAGVREKEEWYVTAFGMDDLKEICYILQPAAFWQRSLARRVGPLDESMHYAFDWDFWIRCGAVTSFEFLDELLACNRVYGDTKTNVGGLRRKAEIAAMLLRHGGFTQRAINAYLAEPYCEAPHRTQPRRLRPRHVLRTAAAIVRDPASACRAAWRRRKLALRILLAPTRLLERSLRQALRRRRTQPGAPAAPPHPTRKAA